MELHILLGHYELFLCFATRKKLSRHSQDTNFSYFGSTHGHHVNITEDSISRKIIVVSTLICILVRALNSIFHWLRNFWRHPKQDQRLLARGLQVVLKGLSI